MIKIMGKDEKIRRIEIAKRLRDARENAGLSQGKLATKLGISRAAVAAWEAGITEPAAGNLRNAAIILNVGAEWLSTGQGSQASGVVGGNQHITLPEGERVNVSQLDPLIARPLIAACATYKAAEVWKLSSDLLCGAGITPGDYLVIDTSAVAKARDIVLADVNGVPVFRVFYPPYLYALPIHAPPPPLVEDHVRTRVRGVMVSRFVA